MLPLSRLLVPLAVTTRTAFVPIACLALASVATAQGQLSWYQTFNSWTTGGYPTYSSDNVIAATFDSSGATYLTGYVTGASAPIDPLTVKITAGGSVAWARSYDQDPAADRGRAIGVDESDGSVYVATSSDDPSSVVQLLKYDSAGNLMWTVPYSGPGAGADRVTATTIPVDAARNVYVGVTSIASTADAVVLSYDRTGVLRWEKRFDGPAQAQDSIGVLLLDPSGELRVGADLDSTQSSGVSGHFSSIVKLSSSGAIAWTATVPASITVNHLKDLEFDPAGNTYALIDDGPDQIVKLDAAGTQLWTGASPDVSTILSALAVDVLGNATVVGTNGNWPYNGDFRIFHFQDDGTFAWSANWNGPSNQHDAAIDVATDATGGITVLGRTTNWTIQQPDSDFVVQRYTTSGSHAWTYQQSSGWTSAGPVRLHAREDGSVLVAGTLATTAATQPPALQSDFCAIKIVDDYERICVADGSFADCPCANTSAPMLNAGCVNSAGSAAKTNRMGLAKLSADTLKLTTTGELPTALSIVLQGQSTISPQAFGDGLRCIGGNLLRLYVKNATAGTVVVPESGEPSISGASAALGEPLSAGWTRGYQVYYRDPVLGYCASPAGSTWNISSGLRITWTN